MIDRWYYSHSGKTLGPVTAAQLCQLAAKGQLEPNDSIWPEGRQQSEAVPAHAAIDFKTPAAAVVNKPDWLDDIRTVAAQTEKTGKPDWLDDVRTAEENEQALLTSFEWDGDNAPSEEEAAAKQLLDELEEVPDSEPETKVAPKHSASCRLVVGSATTRGRVRDRNEDSVLVQQCTWSNRDEGHDVALIVVADGMGGHAAGERASALVVRAFSDVLTPLTAAALKDGSVPDFNEALDRGLQEANRLVRDTAKDNAALKGMGSTAAALLVWDGRAYIHLVGDCRVYHWRAGKLTQVTRDQTLVARMVELGQLTPQEAAVHPRRNEVAQAVGKYALIEPGRYDLDLKAGDWLIACSDGLQAHVADRALSEAIAKEGTSAAELASRLVELANQGGGSDNCTVVAVRCV
jgi:serine/threonine protein phosphatase PrpC